jgi:hypothetical protein
MDHDSTEIFVIGHIVKKTAVASVEITNGSRRVDYLVAIISCLLAGKAAWPRSLSQCLSSAKPIQYWGCFAKGIFPLALETNPAPAAPFAVTYPHSTRLR